LLVKAKRWQIVICHRRHPFAQEPEFAVTSVNYDLGKLLPKAEAPS
jgi:hypothetical protein